jgi:hypothetical protein
MASAEKPALTDADEYEKRQRIEQACRQRDVGALVELASSTGGLLVDDLRRKACMSPLLAPSSWHLTLMHELERAVPTGFRT